MEPTLLLRDTKMGCWRIPAAQKRLGNFSYLFGSVSILTMIMVVHILLFFLNSEIYNVSPDKVRKVAFQQCLNSSKF